MILSIKNLFVPTLLQFAASGSSSSMPLTARDSIRSDSRNPRLDRALKDGAGSCRWQSEQGCKGRKGQDISLPDPLRATRMIEGRTQRHNRQTLSVHHRLTSIKVARMTTQLVTCKIDSAPAFFVKHPIYYYRERSNAVHVCVYRVWWWWWWYVCV